MKRERLFQNADSHGLNKISFWFLFIKSFDQKMLSGLLYVNSHTKRVDTTNIILLLDEKEN